MKKGSTDNLSNSILGDEEAEADLSDIEVNFSNDDADFSPTLKHLEDENHREDEYNVWRCPFPHWTVNRQMYESQIRVLNKENTPE